MGEVLGGFGVGVSCRLPVSPIRSEVGVGLFTDRWATVGVRGDGWAHLSVFDLTGRMVNAKVAEGWWDQEVGVVGPVLSAVADM